MDDVGEVGKDTQAPRMFATLAVLPERSYFARKLAALRRADAYTEFPGRISERETRASWLFFTDRHVYKIKKPIRTASFDFRRQEVRRRNCITEVRLNRRLAARVYLGVVPLVRSGRFFRIGGAGPRVDWLVKMRRLPASVALDRQIAANKIDSAGLVRALKRLAVFFHKAPRIVLDPERFVARFQEEISRCDHVAGREAFGLPVDMVRQAGEALSVGLVKVQPILEDRVRQGYIIEGHGDLRPEHIYLCEPPAVIDCLEFDRNFRLLDPMEEWAFFRMECGRVGAGWIGERGIEIYTDIGGDRPPAVLVDFYTAYSALLRGRLAIQRLESEPNPQTRCKWRDRACEYLSIAISGSAMNS